MEDGVVKYFIKKLDDSLSLMDISKSIELFDSDIVYLGGSLIEGQVNQLSLGMGNVQSDIDVFIIRKDDEYQKTGSVYERVYKKTKFAYVRQFKLDIEIYPVKMVQTLIEIANRISLDIDTRVDNSIELPSYISFFSYNSFISRLFNSVCLKNEDAFNLLKNKIDVRKYLYLCQNKAMNELDNLLQDAKGNLYENELDVALLCVRQAFFEFVKCFLYTKGQFVDRDKWLPLKLRNYQATGNNDATAMYEKYVGLFKSDLTNKDRLTESLHNTIRFIVVKLEEIQYGDELI